MKKTIALILAMMMSVSVALTGCGSSDSNPTEGTTGENQETAPAGEENTDGAETTASAQTKGVKSEEVTGAVLKWNVGNDSKTLDPTLSSAVDSSHVINNTFEGLMRDKNDGKLSQPAMAAEMPEEKTNEDGTVTLTYKLRDAKWSDGQPVKAQDFEYSWKRCVNPATASENSFLMSAIVGYDEIIAGEKDPSELAVKAVDDTTLEVTLKQPTGYFNDLTGLSAFMPLREDIVGSDTDGLWAKDPDKAVSNGPFKLVGYTMGKEFVFAKNENYWNAGDVKIDYITARMTADQGTCLTAFKNGELYIADNAVPNEETQQLVASGEMELIPYISNSFFVVNTQTEIEALQNPKVRQALSMAIDREAIVKNVTGAGEKTAHGIVPFGFGTPDGKDFREAAGDYYLTDNAQVEEAKKLLEEAGYPNGEGMPELEIIYNTSDSLKALGEAVQEMWRNNLGVNVKLVNQEWAVFQDTRTNLQYSALARHAWIGDYLDPQTFLEMFITGNSQSGCGYSNPEFDKAMETAMSTSGQERYDAFYEAEKILMEDAYVIPLYFGVNKVVVNNEKVSGWSMSSTGKFWFGDATVTE